MLTSARPLIAMALLLGATASPALFAQGRTSALIGAQLDKQIKLELANTPLPRVLTAIEEQTGVPVRVSDDVYGTLPWGEQTPITATIQGMTLRDALSAISSKLGLQFDLRDEYVELSPVPSLRRIARRSTLQELRTLDVLGTRRLPVSAQGWTLETLMRALDDALAALDREAAVAKQTPPGLVVEFRPTPDLDPNQQAILVSRDATLTDALDAIAQQTKLTWYPWGDSVVVLPKRDVIAGRLERPVSLRYDGVDVAQVLVDLARQTGVELAIEPGAIQRVTPEFRIIRMSVESASARQALESLQGYTGLGYAITDTGVYVWNQNSNPASASRGRVIATITTPSGANVLIYEDMLSPEARDALRAEQQHAAAKLDETLSRATSRPVEPAN